MNKPEEAKKQKGRHKGTRAEKAAKLSKQNTEVNEQQEVDKPVADTITETPVIEKKVNKKEAAKPIADKTDNIEENIVEDVIPEENKIGSDLNELGLTKDDLKEDNPHKNDFDPLRKPVAERGYESGNINTNPSGNISSPGQRDIPESQYVGDTPITGAGNGNGENNNPDDVFGDGGSGNNGGSDNNNFGGHSEPYNPQPNKPSDSGGGGISSPPKPVAGEKERRRNADKTADICINAYSNIAPVPFKKMATFNIAKVERMEMNNEISLDMPVLKDKTTVIQYMLRENDKADALFEVSEETKESIKAPLVDFILEKGGELSPGWRLVTAIGSHILSMTGIAIQMLIAKNQAMEQFQQFHADALKSGAYRHSPVNGNQQQPQPEQPKSAAEKRREKQNKNEENEKPAMDMETYIHDDIPEPDENDSSITIVGQPPKEEQ